MLRQAVIAAGMTVLAGGPAAAATAFEHVSCKGEPFEIRITVSNVKQSAGLMTVELFRNDPDGFLKVTDRLKDVSPDPANTLHARDFLDLADQLAA